MALLCCIFLTATFLWRMIHHNLVLIKMSLFTYILVHFWDWHHHKGFDWYINQLGFPQKRPADNTINPLYGEITPCYVVLPPSTISEIHNCFPELKVVFVARDLVDRAWSAMIMELRDQSMGLNAGEFGNGIIPGGGGNNEQSKKRAKKSSQNTTLTVAQQRRIQQQSSPSAQPDSYYLERLRSETHTSRSDYATHLKNWYRHFPSKNVLIIDFRDIASKPREVLLKIAMHIGLDEKDAKNYIEQLSDDDVRQRVNAATSNSMESKSPANQKASSDETSQHILSERPRLRKQMEQYLNPYATSFNLLLKEEGYSWQLNEYAHRT